MPRGRPSSGDSASWGADATERLLRLRYEVMAPIFAASRNNRRTGRCWVQLADELSLLTGQRFTSAQCRSKLKALRRKWAVSSAKKRADSPVAAVMHEFWGGHDDAQRTDERSSAASEGSVSVAEAAEASDASDAPVAASSTVASHPAAPDSSSVAASIAPVRLRPAGPTPIRPAPSSADSLPASTATDAALQTLVAPGLLAVADGLKNIGLALASSSGTSSESNKADAMTHKLLLRELHRQGELLRRQNEQLARQAASIEALVQLVSQRDSAPSAQSGE